MKSYISLVVHEPGYFHIEYICKACGEKGVSESETVDSLLKDIKHRIFTDWKEVTIRMPDDWGFFYVSASDHLALDESPFWIFCPKHDVYSLKENTK